MLQRNLATLLLTMGLMGCSSQKSFQADPPFTVTDATARMWTGGREASGSGMELQMRWTPGDNGTARPDALYFRGHRMEAVLEDTETGMVLKGEYLLVAPSKGDMIMHADGREEVGNQPPLPLPEADFPFELRPDEAVISYTRLSDGKQFYFKVEGIKEKQGRIYPGRQGQ
ncbi:hypothetical protein [Robiginitalea sp. SC105]|uniref:hypothetical protein n=1 Tax=Robiginitalea sp. SC105 TaxID=2762332 RepID=UPI00163B100C|nr:hypothetical protein [Robiginitalea sp. SC105]MBC2838267.1 hypothetical protein [Robiginitalea sp. SC105]